MFREYVDLSYIKGGLNPKWLKSQQKCGFPVQ
uniref:Uncharacterized protein n=1 Tax=Arundo donax TaxID=35708 RepID=A0A0A9FZP1_ARUDO